MQQNLEEVGSSLATVNSLVVSEDLRLTIDSVLAGNGISFISRSLVGEQLNAGSLQRFVVPEFRQVRCRSVVLPRQRVDGK